MRYLCTLFLLMAAGVQAQTEAALKVYFEGKKVVLKLDIPGSKEGLEIHPKAQPMVNPKRYSSRLLQFGFSVRRGDRVAFTAVHVKDKSIELQVEGGDYGILSDDTNVSPLITSSPKNEQVSKRHVLGNGRFTIWYPDKSLKTATPEPAELQRILSEYVDFSGGLNGPLPRVSSPPSDLGSKLKKGMTEIQVSRILGVPRQSREHLEGELDVVTNTFLSEHESIEVDFVKGALVNFRIRPR